jgi:UDP-N-acetylglucosamine 4,6-dehydratase
MKIIDLAYAISPNATIDEIGLRPGEKLHEEMISADDSRRTIILGDRFLVTPVVAEWGFETPEGTLMKDGEAYRSDTNTQWLTTTQISEFIESGK